MADKSKSLKIPAGTYFLMSWYFPLELKVTTTIAKGDVEVRHWVDPSSQGKSKLGGVTLSAALQADGADPVPIDFPGTDPAGRPGPKSPGSQAWVRGFNTIVNTTNLAPAQYVFLAEFDNGNTLTANVEVTAPSSKLSPKRQAMLDLIGKWMPTSLLGARKLPDGPKDLLELARWTKAQGEASKAVSDKKKANAADFAKKKAEWDAKAAARKKDPSLPDPGPAPVAPVPVGVVTSCGDVLAALLRLWGCDFDKDHAMSVRSMRISLDGMTDADNLKHLSPWGARHYQGRYVESSAAFAKSPPQLPEPGDIVVLRDGPAPSNGGVGHVGIIVSVSSDTWFTADGGGGATATRRWWTAGSCWSRSPTPNTTRPISRDSRSERHRSCPSQLPERRQAGLAFDRARNTLGRQQPLNDGAREACSQHGANL